ncbi:MAG: hypothetical protein AB1656_01610 [Candidatus Omnitrophota bacterium]
MEKKSSHIPCLLALFLPVAVFHWKIIFLGWILCGGDMINQFVPWREFALEEIRNGRFPFWNPYVFCGAPFAANIQTSLFYPFNLFNLFFSVERTFSLSLVFHQSLAQLAMYWFLWKLWGSKSGAVLGALVYGWSGFFITHGSDGHLIHIRACAWLPLVLHFQTQWREKRTKTSLVLFAFSLSAMFYGGHTQIPLYVFYLVLLRALWWGFGDWRASGRWRSILPHPIATAIGLAFSLGLGALVLFPLLQLSRHTAERAGGARYEFAVNDSLPPAHLITLAAPFFYGIPASPEKENIFWETRTGYHEICGYAGAFSLLLFILAFLPSPESETQRGESFRRREAYFFLAAAMGGILFSLGRYTLLYSLLYYGLPGWSYFRVPGRLVLLYILGASVCAARGLSLCEHSDWKKIKDAAAIKIAAVLSIGLAAFVLILALSKPAVLHYLRDVEIDRTIMEYRLWNANRTAISAQLPDRLFAIRYSWMLKSSLIAIGFLAAGGLSLLAMKKIGKTYGWLFPAAVVLLDLFLFSYRFFPAKPAEAWRKEYFPQTELVSFLQKNAQGWRVLCLDDAIGYPGLDSHPELRPNRLMHYRIETARGYDPIILKSFTRYANRMFGHPPETPQGGLLFFPTVPEQDYLNDMNIRYIVTTQTLNPPYREVWREAASPMKIYENPSAKSRIFMQDSTVDNLIQVTKSTPVEILFSIQKELSVEKPQTIIWSHTVYPGWRFQSNGENPSLVLYEDVFLAGRVKAGHESLAFRYVPDWPFHLGATVTLFSLFAGLIVGWTERKKARPNSLL